MDPFGGPDPSIQGTHFDRGSYAFMGSTPWPLRPARFLSQPGSCFRPVAPAGYFAFRSGPLGPEVVPSP
jgi:hypothetical protein